MLSEAVLVIGEQRLLGYAVVESQVCFNAENISGEKGIDYEHEHEERFVLSGYFALTNR